MKNLSSLMFKIIGIVGIYAGLVAFMIFIIKPAESRPVQIPSSIIEPAPSAPVEKDLGLLPEECRPWRPSAPSVELEEKDNPEVEGIKGRMFCTKRGIAGPDQDPKGNGEISCGFWSILNVENFASEELFPFIKVEDGPDKGKRYRAPCGGGTECKEPYKTDEVSCVVNLTKCETGKEWPITEQVDVICRGDRFCGLEKAADCCKIIKRRKVNIPQMELTEEDKDKFAKERCKGLKERHDTCVKFCLKDKYMKECSNYWHYLGGPECLKF